VTGATSTALWGARRPLGVLRCEGPLGAIKKVDEAASPMLLASTAIGGAKEKK